MKKYVLENGLLCVAQSSVVLNLQARRLLLDPAIHEEFMRLKVSGLANPAHFLIHCSDWTSYAYYLSKQIYIDTQPGFSSFQFWKRKIE